MAAQETQELARAVVTFDYVFPILITSVGFLISVIGLLIYNQLKSMQRSSEKAMNELKGALQQVAAEMKVEDRHLHARISGVSDHVVDVDRRVTRIETRCDDAQQRRSTDPVPKG